MARTLGMTVEDLCRTLNDIERGVRVMVVKPDNKARVADLHLRVLGAFAAFNGSALICVIQDCETPQDDVVPIHALQERSRTAFDFEMCRQHREKLAPLPIRQRLLATDSPGSDVWRIVA